MIKEFRVGAGDDLSITLHIDTSVMTETLAKEVNGFWGGAEEVLRESKGCIFQAVARRAAGPLLSYLMDGYGLTSAVSQLADQEGWPKENIGITVIWYEIPDLDPISLSVEECPVMWSSN
jgi:Protein of unknown function (DUF2528)